jgi:hypothetical protein
MLHNGLLKLTIGSTCFGHYCAHHQELATIQMAPACGTSPWLWQVAGLVHGCRFKRPAITNVRCHTLGPSVESQAPDDGYNNARNILSES